MDSSRTVAVFVGSLRKDSVNCRLARALIELAPAGLAARIVEIGDLPLYNQDLDGETPWAWTAFRGQVRAADALLAELAVRTSTAMARQELSARFKSRIGRRLSKCYGSKVNGLSVVGARTQARNGGPIPP
jgi:hypothetical protein